MPPAFERVEEVAAARTAPSSTDDVPSITFSATLPVKPSVTITSASPVPIAKPSTLPTKFSRDSVSESTAWAATRSSGPFEGSSPLLSSATRGRETPIAVSMNAAPMCANCTRCSGRTSTLAPASSSRNGEPGTGTSTASAGRWIPRPRLMRNSEAASAVPVEPPETSASARPSATAATAATIEASGLARTARAGSSALAIETGASIDLDALGHLADLGRGPEQQHAHAVLGHRGGSAARDLGGAVVGPVRVNRDGDRVGHRPLASDRGRDRARRLPRHLAPVVEAAVRAHAVRTARRVALRAAVQRRRGDLVLRAALGGARMRLLLLGDGHGGREG